MVPSNEWVKLIDAIVASHVFEPPLKRVGLFFVLYSRRTNCQLEPGLCSRINYSCATSDSVLYWQFVEICSPCSTVNAIYDDSMCAKEISHLLIVFTLHPFCEAQTTQVTERGTVLLRNLS